MFIIGQQQRYLYWRATMLVLRSANSFLAALGNIPISTKEKMSSD
jgi:hypothetical protein